MGIVVRMEDAGKEKAPPTGINGAQPTEEEKRVPTNGSLPHPPVDVKPFPPIPPNLGREVNIQGAMGRPPEPIPWAVDGFIAEGDISLIQGRGGIGKSFVLTGLAIALATGSPLFGEFTITRPYRVLYLDKEMSEWETKRRFVRLLGGIGLVQPHEFPGNLMVGGAGPLVLDEEAPLELAKYVRDCEIDFVLIDTLRRALIGDENDTRTANRTLKHIQMVQRARACGFIFLHHWRKRQESAEMNDPSEMGRGAGWREVVDCTINITSHKLDEHMSILPDKSRHELSRDPFLVRFDHTLDDDDGNGPLILVYVGDEKNIEVQGHIYKYIQKFPGCTRTEVEAALRISRKVFRNSLDKLLKSKLIKRDHRGSGGVGGGAIRYYAI